MSSLFLIRMDGKPAVDSVVSKQRLHVRLRRHLPRGWWVCIAVLSVAVAGSSGTILTQFVRQAHKERCAEKLKSLGVAMLKYHEAHGHFPAAAITDKNGTPLLSWRVTILPQLGYQSLYDA